MLKAAADLATNKTTGWLGGLVIVLWLAMISAPVIESDAYRYAAIMLIALVLWFDRPAFRLLRRDFFAILCLGWGAYALVRFIFGFTILGEKGSSEWLYAFPLLFPGLGVALYWSRRYILPTVTAFILAAFVALLVSTDFVTALSGERIFPLYHNNPIHAAIGCGFILIVSGYWLWHLWESGLLAGWPGVVAPVISAGNIGLSLFDIYGAKSKGVWLALAFAILAISSLSLIHRYSRRVVVMLVAGLLVIGAGIYAVRDNLVEFAGSTATAAFSLSLDAAREDTMLGAMRQAIEAPSTPESMRERLELWYNAIEIIERYPVFGAGNDWLRLWHQTTYANVPYDLLHNGYLEIAVRHGFFGLLALVLSLIICFRRLVAARRLGIISRAAEMGLLVATLYFLVTLATNSNNRLALGESFFMVAAAAVIAASIAIRNTETRTVSATAA